MPTAPLNRPALALGTDNLSDDLTNASTPAAPTSGEEDLRLYLGDNSDPYITLWDRIRASGHPFVWSWNWWGLLFPVPWLFYRKLWSIGATLVLLPVLLEAMIGFGSKAGLVMAALVAAIGKPLVIERAERKIRAVNALDLLSQESIGRLRLAGGVSLPGAVIGALLMFSSLSLALYDELPVRLPGCAAPVIREVVLEIATDNPDMIGFGASRLRLDRVRQHGTVIDDQGRLCHAELRAGEESVAIEYDIVWQTAGARQFVVDLRLRDD